MAASAPLPLFPLGVVLYPEERMPLHIFEPRYKEMIGRCLEAKQPFGIVLFTEGEMAEFGCTAHIQRVINRYDDGRLDIEVEGGERFRIVNYTDDEAYLTATVVPIAEPAETLQRDLRQRVIAQHMKLLELAGRTVEPMMYNDVNRVSYFIAHNAGLTLPQKIEVLKLVTENDRMAFLVAHMEAFIPRVEQMEEVRRRIRSNGNLKDFPPEEE